ncbi:metaxin-1 isoform X2 [Tachypleus tridentatus]|uniref:metaxin-1 isoform X2 n=1 Tax=Tachypleus tridentatus TaxID=6853 RepID=UPI003FD5ADCD
MDMILETWEGDWGLPSIDLFALQIMAYAKFSGAPLKLNKTNKPWHSPNGQLPVFRHGPKKRFSRFGDITAYLRGQNYNADFDLTKKQCSDVVAYSSLLRDKLYPAFLYILWVDNKNYTELTRPWFIKVLPFPVKHFLPGYFQKKAQKIIYNFTGYDELEKEEMENFPNIFRCSNFWISCHIVTNTISKCNSSKSSEGVWELNSFCETHFTKIFSPECRRNGSTKKQAGNKHFSRRFGFSTQVAELVVCWAVCHSSNDWLCICQWFSSG